MKCKLSCYMLPYREATVERALEGIAAAGFEYVTLSALKSAPQVSVEEMTEQDLEELRQTMSALGLTAAAVGAHHAVHTDEGKEWVRRRIEFAHAVGAEIVDTGAVRMVPAGAPAEEKREIAHQQQTFFKNLRELAEFAKGLGVRIALETHGGLTGTGAMCAMTLKQIGEDTVGIAYDPANIVYYEDEDPAKDVDKIARSVYHVHLQDFAGSKETGEIRDFGQGDVDYLSLFKALRNAGFSGPVSVERAAGETLEDVDRTVAQIRQRVLEVLDKV